MKTSLLVIPSLILLASFSAVINAGIVDNDTFTTNTGLDWLGVIASINKSYNYVTQQLELDGQYAGYRYATAEEFNSLVSHYTGGESHSNTS